MFGTVGTRVSARKSTRYHFHGTDSPEAFWTAIVCGRRETHRVGQAVIDLETESAVEGGFEAEPAQGATPVKLKTPTKKALHTAVHGSVRTHAGPPSIHGSYGRRGYVRTSADTYCGGGARLVIGLVFVGLFLVWCQCFFCECILDHVRTCTKNRRRPSGCERRHGTAPLAAPAVSTGARGRPDDLGGHGRRPAYSSAGVAVGQRQCWSFLDPVVVSLILAEACGREHGPVQRAFVGDPQRSGPGDCQGGPRL